jgi:hypothetical protein
MEYENQKRYETLNKGQLLLLLDMYEKAVSAITAPHTFEFTGKIHVDKDAITEKMIGELQHANNMLWHYVQQQEINKMMGEASKS